MTPRSPRSNVLDSVDRGAMLFSNNPKYSFVVKDCMDLLIGQANVWICRAHTSGRSIFVFHVCHILGLRAKKKMIDVDAGRRITSVTDKHAFWNWSSRNHPSQTMRQLLSKIFYFKRRIPSATGARPTEMTSSQGFWNRVMVQSLLDRPVCGCFKSLSHCVLLIAAVVRAGARASTRPGSLYFNSNERTLQWALQP